ncbi:MAG: hypothetical protein HY287_06715 [Planctomycetes bacterium]|nr:hypothetical protein [Planctomycetota bacterium]
MIGPVTNQFIRNPAGSSSLNGISQSSFAPAGATRASGNSGVGALLGTENISFAQIAQQVSQLLKSVGGGLENDPNLQMVIGLLILMTLLSQSQQSKAPVDLSNLIGRGGAGGGGTAISAYSSYTSITISDGNMSMTASASQTYAAISSPQGTTHPTFDTQA